MCAAYFVSVRNALQTPTIRQGRMLLENLPAAHMKRIRTDSNLRVKLHKTKRKLAESPAIDIANTFERLRIAPLAAHSGCASRRHWWIRAWDNLACGHFLTRVTSSVFLQHMRELVLPLRQAFLTHAVNLHSNPPPPAHPPLSLRLHSHCLHCFLRLHSHLCPPPPHRSPKRSQSQPFP